MSELDLPRSAIIEGLTASQRRMLLDSAKPRSYPPGAVILEEGKQDRGLWLVTQGRVEVVKMTVGGPPQTLAELGPGAVFGEMSFFSPVGHAASVRGVTAVETLKLTGEAFAALERSAPDLTYSLTRAIVVVLSERLRRMDEWTGRLLGEMSPCRRQEWSDFRARLYNDWEF